ncbi:MAG: hypothetical protein ABI639_08085 [Thermoanaerobaculia bacterium]
MRALRTSGSLWRNALRSASVLLCTLLAASGAFELHNPGNLHRELPEGTLLERAASHPASPHHFDRSRATREAECVACALQAHSRGVTPHLVSRIEPAPQRIFQLASAPAAVLARFSSSSSPRGPPSA